MACGSIKNPAMRHFSAAYSAWLAMLDEFPCKGQGRTEGLTLLLTAAHPMVTALHMRKVHFVPVQCIPTGNNSECCGKTTCGGSQAVHPR